MRNTEALRAAVAENIPDGEVVVAYLVMVATMTSDDAYGYVVLSAPNQPPHVSVGLAEMIGQRVYELLEEA